MIFFINCNNTLHILYIYSKIKRRSTPQSSRCHIKTSWINNQHQQNAQSVIIKKTEIPVATCLKFTPWPSAVCQVGLRLSYDLSFQRGFCLLMSLRIMVEGGLSDTRSRASDCGNPDADKEPCVLVRAAAIHFHIS